MRAQCVQSVLSSANADAVIGALSAAEALLPAPCGSVRAFAFPLTVESCFLPAAHEPLHFLVALQLAISANGIALGCW